MWPMPPQRLAELELERMAWGELTALATTLTTDERLIPGYFSDPPWSVKDLIGHVTAWHVEAREHLLDMGANGYVPHDLDIDSRNSQILRRLSAASWETGRRRCGVGAQGRGRALRRASAAPPGVGFGAGRASLPGTRRRA
jgi:hypothetical protein